MHTCPVAQRVPHAPQCVASELSSVSQPLSMFPSQFPNPVAHVNPHTPPGRHVGFAPARIGHALPHEPQFTTDSSEVSQPSLATPLQFANPLWHVMTVQAPPEQPAVTVRESVQTLPQAPQFVGSLCVSRQARLQHVPQHSPGSPVAPAQAPPAETHGRQTPPCTVSPAQHSPFVDAVSPDLRHGMQTPPTTTDPSQHCSPPGAVPLATQQTPPFGMAGEQQVRPAGGRSPEW